ncbi:hypothetical protein [Haloquadratum walsbyi]|uniref:Uncharacterized protein n=1 Tax=Haloquadratum walsbyi (strain DSM 16790 / HBSQ001) TaxID=362976 RepID=Q18EM7_HALWD|nr:hypothetical protein [Haloquadratum walsbyi]CAJ53596.1 uncharacterized protein HQ_3505A [Haloquadratum walsbyi DSM 16790]
MILSLRTRILIVIILLVGYAPALFLEIRGETPLYENYESHVGETVYDLNGIVVSTDPVEISVAGDRLRLTVRDLNMAVDSGDKIRIFGTVKPDRVIEAENVIVAGQSPSQLRTYLISFIAGLWALFRIIRDFDIDWGELALVPADTQQESHD